MATIIWCDRVRHIVQESRTEVADFIRWSRRPEEPDTDEFGNEIPKMGPGPGWIYVTPVDSIPERPHQRCLRVDAISSFEALPGDGI